MRGAGFRLYILGFRVQGFMFRVLGVGARVLMLWGGIEG